MKIIFMGTPTYAEEILKTLIASDDIEVVALYTQPDKPVGRKKVMTPPTPKLVAIQNGIEVYQPKRVRDEETIKELLHVECDFIVVAAYGQILPQEILDHAPCINLHASILPAYRGASPIQQTLLNGDNQTGVTAMLMDIGLDTGDILKIDSIDVNNDEMVSSLFDRLTTLASTLTLEVLREFNSLKPIKQDDAESTHCKKITKADGEVRLENAVEIYNRYRAFTPWPGIYLESGLKLKKIRVESPDMPHKEGEILTIDNDSIVIGCKQGSLRLFRVQPTSKKEMDILSYINGKRLTIADTLS